MFEIFILLLLYCIGGLRYLIADHEQNEDMSTAKHHRTCQMSFCILLIKGLNYFIDFVSMITSSFKVEVYYSRPHLGNSASEQNVNCAYCDLTRFWIEDSL